MIGYCAKFFQAVLERHCNFSTADNFEQHAWSKLCLKLGESAAETLKMLRQFFERRFKVGRLPLEDERSEQSITRKNRVWKVWKYFINSFMWNAVEKKNHILYQSKRDCDVSVAWRLWPPEVVVLSEVQFPV